MVAATVRLAPQDVTRMVAFGDDLLAYRVPERRTGIRSTMAGQGKRMRWLATAAAGIGMAAALGVGAPAQADTPLAIQTLGCIPQGENLVECVVAVTGGTAPYTYH